MNDRRKWQLLARRLAGEATPEELEELEQIIKEDPLLSHQHDVNQNFWNSHSLSDEEDDSEAKFQRLLKKRKPRSCIKSEVDLTRPYIQNHFL